MVDGGRLGKEKGSIISRPESGVSILTQVFIPGFYFGTSALSKGTKRSQIFKFSVSYKLVTENAGCVANDLAAGTVIQICDEKCWSLCR